MNEPTEQLIDLPLEDWKPLFIEKAKDGWHYVTIGPICNCFSSCWTCEALGYFTHEGADWADGLGWQQYTGPMRTLEDIEKLREERKKRND